MTPREAAIRAFEKRFGAEPDGVAFAPGRINLIGEHVDYNDGLVLPMVVAQGTAVAWSRIEGEFIDVYAAELQANDRFTFASPSRPPTADWTAYCRGMVANTPVQSRSGMRMAVTGDLPRGAGMSSSASLCVAVGRSLAEMSGQDVSPVTLARAAQQTEHDYAGVACGIMDQMVIAAGETGAAMLLDCRNLSFTSVAIPREWIVLVVDSGVTRGLVESEYNVRRAQCAEAAHVLGVASLRDVTIAALERANLSEPLDRRARHVVSEIGRVREAVDALSTKDLPGLTRILREGHASLRDLFEVSVPSVDALVARLDSFLGDEGAARMTGAGFGGSVIVVATRAAALRVLQLYGPAARAIYGLPSE